ncbi:uncharacterized protein [Watersipora subatra]|uniref:uncharacterized protein isoform X2 n=1 Tax=Watersipora subatra TaxID=2589382 RepID=UPI00355B6E77
MLRKYFRHELVTPDLLDPDTLDEQYQEPRTFIDKLLRRRKFRLEENSTKKKKQSNLRTQLALQRNCRLELRDQGIQGVDAKLLRELDEDNVEQSIIGEEIAQLSEEYDLRAITWRQRMVHFLHTMPVEVFMMFLVVLDVFIILSMFVLDMYVLEEQNQLLDKKGKEILSYLNHSWPDIHREILYQSNIDGAYQTMVNAENYSYYSAGLAGGESDDVHNIQKRASSGGAKPYEGNFGQKHLYDAALLIHNSTKANFILHYCSVAILSVFVIEVALKVIGYGKSYFKNKWEVIDGVVIIVSFSLDVAVSDQNFSHEVGKTVLVVLLIWRVIRILNAMVLTSRARTMFRLRVLRKSKRLAEDKNKQLSVDIADLQAEVKRLRDLAKSYGADEHEIVSAEVLSKTAVSTTKAGLKNMMAQLLQINTKIATSKCGQWSVEFGEQNVLSVSASKGSVNVSCSSLNKLRVANGYNRNRRPSMIGDETMCHETKHATDISQLTPEVQGPMRPRAASDAGGITGYSRKLRDNITELKKKGMGSGGITQDEIGSNQSMAFDVFDGSSNDSESNSLVEQSYEVVDEFSEQKGAKRSTTSTTTIDEDSETETADKSVDESMVCSASTSAKGHTNPAFTADEMSDDSGGSEGTRESHSSEDSGYSPSLDTKANMLPSNNLEEANINSSDKSPLSSTQENNSSDSSTAPQSSETTEAAKEPEKPSNTERVLEELYKEPEEDCDVPLPQSNRPVLTLPQISITCADNLTTQTVL